MNQNQNQNQGKKKDRNALEIDYNLQPYHRKWSITAFTSTALASVGRLVGRNALGLIC